MYQKAYKINNYWVSRINRFSKSERTNILIEIDLKKLSISQVNEVIWRIRGVTDTGITEKESNELTKESTFIYMVIKDKLSDSVYIDLMGFLWLDKDVYLEKKKIDSKALKVVNLDELGKYIDVPTISDIKAVINVIDLLSEDNAFSYLPYSVYQKLARLKDSDLEELANIILSLNKRSTDILNARSDKDEEADRDS